MALRPTHEIHKRRFGRNLGVGLLLIGFVVLVFALTVVKVLRGELMTGGYEAMGDLPASGAATE